MGTHRAGRVKTRAQGRGHPVGRRSGWFACIYAGLPRRRALVLRPATGRTTRPRQCNGSRRFGRGWSTRTGDPAWPRSSTTGAGSSSDWNTGHPARPAATRPARGASGGPRRRRSRTGGGPPRAACRRHRRPGRDRMAGPPGTPPRRQRRAAPAGPSRSSGVTPVATRRCTRTAASARLRRAGRPARTRPRQHDREHGATARPGGGEGSDLPTDAEGWRGVWEELGVVCDELSSRVLVHNLLLTGIAGACRLTTAADGEPIWLTWRAHRHVHGTRRHPGVRVREPECGRGSIGTVSRTRSAEQNSSRLTWRCSMVSWWRSRAISTSWHVRFVGFRAARGRVGLL